MSEISLLTVTHDPKGRYIPLFHRLQNEIENLYAELYITVSDESSIELIRELEKSSFNVKVIPKNGAANARREVVNFGLTGETHYYHYCDFDRLLTWGTNHLNELKNISIKIPHHDYLIFGRTERAINTHPIEWIETEMITNKICSLELGKNVDITAGSCSFSRKCAEYISRYSKERMTDAEWAMIAHRMAKLNVDYTSVEGLEYHEDSNGILRNICESEKWLSRLQLSFIISETAVKVGK